MVSLDLQHPGEGAVGVLGSVRRVVVVVVVASSDGEVVLGLVAGHDGLEEGDELGGDGRDGVHGVASEGVDELRVVEVSFRVRDQERNLWGVRLSDSSSFVVSEAVTTTSTHTTRDRRSITSREPPSLGSKDGTTREPVDPGDCEIRRDALVGLLHRQFRECNLFASTPRK